MLLLQIILRQSQGRKPQPQLPVVFQPVPAHFFRRLPPFFQIRLAHHLPHGFQGDGRAPGSEHADFRIPGQHFPQPCLRLPAILCLKLGVFRLQRPNVFGSIHLQSPPFSSACCRAR